MRKLVLSPMLVVLGFGVFSLPAYGGVIEDIQAATNCGNPTSNTDKSRCAAVKGEARCQLSGGSVGGRSCGEYGREFSWMNGSSPVASTDDLRSAFTNYTNNLKARADQCCGSGACETTGGSEPEHDVTGGSREVAQKNATWAKWMGTNAAYQAGVCDANKAVCQVKLKKIKQEQPTRCPNCDANALDAICDSSFASSSDRIRTADDNFAKMDESNRIADETSADPGKGGDKDKTGDKSTAKNDGKSQKKNGMNPMSSLASMAGPLMQALMQQQQQQPQTQQQPTMPSVNCGPGVVSPTCPAEAGTAAVDPWANSNKGASNFQTASTKGAGFNTGDLSKTPGTGNPNLPATDPSQNPGLGAAVVANGGGNFIGGGGSSGGGGGGAVSASAAQPVGKITDIDKGTTSYGSPLSGQNQAMSTSTSGGGGGFSGYGKGEAEQPVNWAEWLPGGKRDPARTLAGGNMRPASAQIQSKEVNIWNRISDHIKTRCSQGLLRDCIP